MSFMLYLVKVAMYPSVSLVQRVSKVGSSKS